MMTGESRRGAVLWGARVLVLAGSLLLLGLALALLGEEPASFLAGFVRRAFGSPSGVAWTLLEAQPLILMGLSVVVARQVGLWNAGAEGQYLVGMMAAAWVGVHAEIPVFLHPLVCLLAAMLAASLYGWIGGALRAFARIETLLSGILLNAGAFALYGWLFEAPGMRDAAGRVLSMRPTAGLRLFERGFPAWLGGWLEGQPLLREFLSAPVHWGFLAVVAACLAVAFLRRRAVAGYEFRAVAENPEAARHGGITPESKQMLAMAWAGALGGLAGAVQLLGPTMPHALVPMDRVPGYGLAGLAVSFAGTLPVGGVLGMSLLFAVCWSGGESGWMPEAWVFVWMALVVVLSALLPTGGPFLRPRAERAREVKA